MNGYEVLFILKAHLSEEEYKKKEENFKKWVDSHGGKIIEMDIIGLKNLPVTFKDHTQGYFIRVQFKANNDVLNEIYKRMAVDETVLRYLNVKLESIMPAEQVKEKMRIS